MDAQIERNRRGISFSLRAVSNGEENAFRRGAPLKLIKTTVNSLIAQMAKIGREFFGFFSLTGDAKRLMVIGGSRFEFVFNIWPNIPTFCYATFSSLNLNIEKNC